MAYLSGRKQEMEKLRAIKDHILNFLKKKWERLKIFIGGAPQGLTREQFARLSNRVRERAGNFGSDIRVHGSRAAGAARAASDIDIASRVSLERFDESIRTRFGTPNPGSAKAQTMRHAIRTGKIQAGEAGLRGLRRELERELGMNVDISVIQIGGAFDRGPWVALQ